MRAASQPPYLLFFSFAEYHLYILLTLLSLCDLQRAQELNKHKFVGRRRCNRPTSEERRTRFPESLWKHHVQWRSAERRSQRTESGEGGKTRRRRSNVIFVAG